MKSRLGEVAEAGPAPPVNRIVRFYGVPQRRWRSCWLLATTQPLLLTAGLGNGFTEEIGLTCGTLPDAAHPAAAAQTVKGLARPDR